MTHLHRRPIIVKLHPMEAYANECVVHRTASLLKCMHVCMYVRQSRMSALVVATCPWDGRMYVRGWCVQVARLSVDR